MLEHLVGKHPGWMQCWGLIYSISQSCSKEVFRYFFILFLVPLLRFLLFSSRYRSTCLLSPSNLYPYPSLSPYSKQLFPSISSHPPLSLLHRSIFSSWLSSPACTSTSLGSRQPALLHSLHIIMSSVVHGDSCLISSVYLSIKSDSGKTLNNVE